MRPGCFFPPLLDTTPTQRSAHPRCLTHKWDLVVDDDGEKQDDEAPYECERPARLIFYCG